ncbi:MAG TPA: sugar ABC transporter permease [Alphaproteobacteria bacterium]|nr:sugar ABC transporter permease [Alphaproteobacteria bacterium]
MNRQLSTSHPRWAPYFFMAPFVLIFCTFLIYPLGQSIVLAMQQTFGPKTSMFVGTKNFTDLLADRFFWLAMRNTFVYAVATVALQVPLSLGLAMVLNRPRLKGRPLFRLIFFSPSLVGIVFVAMMFALMFHEREGLVNVFLRTVIPHFPREFPWLQRYVMPALIIASLWMSVGFNMIYFLAALQSVDRESLEAAEIDGANSWQKFRFVILPEIAPVTRFVVLLSLIGSFQLFELPFILLNGPGPENRGLTVVMYLYQYGFEVGDLGYASAIGWTLALVLMGFTIIQRRLSRES